VRAFGNPGVAAALAAALLFGIATPLAKLLLGQTSPWLLAGLFYAGSGIGLFVLRRVRRAPKVVLARNDCWDSLSSLAGCCSCQYWHSYLLARKCLT
jgi:drug/metabolite transporter (DMT)-like permease